MIICPRDVDEDTKKVMFDINILYTSVPEEFRVEGLYYFVTKYVEDLHLRFRKEFLLESANFILKKKNSLLRFGSELPLHKKKTAMCTIFAPTYTFLTMQCQKTKVYSIIRQCCTLSSKHLEHSWL